MLKDIVENIKVKENRLRESSNKLIIYSGSESKVQKVYDELQRYEEKHGYPYQGYMTYTKDYRKYVLEVDDVSEYEKHKSWMEKIIKKFG
jgi:virulence-associated protein VapD